MALPLLRICTNAISLAFKFAADNEFVLSTVQDSLSDQAD
jgi:hypothetical protein